MIVGGVLGGLLVVGTIAVAGQSRFAPPEEEPDGVGQALTERQARGLAEEAEDSYPVTHSESASVAEAEEAGLLPFQWPWFNDAVATPPDAISAAPELRRALEAVPALDGLRLISTEELFVDGSDYLQMQGAWLKVDDTQMIRIVSQILPEEAWIDQEDWWEPVESIPSGEATFYARPGAIYTRQVIGDRTIGVDLQATQREHTFAFTEEELIEIGSAIIRALEE